MSWDRLKSAFKVGMGADVLNIEESKSRVRIQLRVPRERVPSVLTFVERATLANEPWGIDVSKHVFLCRDGKVRYAWRIILFTEHGLILDHESTIADIIERSGAQSQPTSVDAYPLPVTATARRNQPVNGKGANPTGTGDFKPTLFRAP